MTKPQALIGPHDRVVVHVRGDDRASYLDAVLTQRLRDASPGTAAAALELGPHGEPHAAVELGVLEDEIVLLVAPQIADEMIPRLAGRTFLSQVTFENDADAVVHRVRGPQAAAIAAAVACPAGTAVARDGVLWLGWHHGLDLVGDPTAVAAATDTVVEAGATPASADELDDAEILTGVPRIGDEIARGRLPEEIGLLPTHVHLDKGCYPGQEAVARMWMLGRPRRALVVLSLDDDTAVTGPGTYGEGNSRVEVTRVSDGGPTRHALAFVAADTTVGASPLPGTSVRSIVGDGLPVPGHDPAVPRRRDRRALR